MVPHESAPEQVFGGRLAHAIGQQHGRGRREHAQLDLGLAELRSGCGEDAVAGECHFETAAQARELTLLGCPLAQGYHFAKPLDSHHITRLLEDTRTSLPTLTPAVR